VTVALALIAMREKAPANSKPGLTGPGLDTSL